MIILFKGFGNHSNRLLQNLHFEAFCYEYGLQYTNPTFSDMCQYYKSPVNSKKRYLAMLLGMTITRYPLKYGLNLNIISFKEADVNTKILLECKNKDCFVEGWNFKAPELTAKHQDYFIEKYSLKDRYYKNNSLYEKLTSISRDTTMVVGIHIRRGDYKSWQNGKYFFRDDVYKKYMQNVSDEIRNQHNKDVFFIIFSNESTKIEENYNTYISNNDWYVDHLLMSKCDFLIGPPSTFTIWASYIGKTRLFL